MAEFDVRSPIRKLDPGPVDLHLRGQWRDGQLGGDGAQPRVGDRLLSAEVGPYEQNLLEGRCEEPIRSAWEDLPRIQANQLAERRPGKFVITDGRLVYGGGQVARLCRKRDRSARCVGPRLAEIPPEIAEQERVELYAPIAASQCGDAFCGVVLLKPEHAPTPSFLERLKFDGGATAMGGVEFGSGAVVGAELGAGLYRSGVGRDDRGAIGNLDPGSGSGLLVSSGHAFAAAPPSR